MLVHIKIHQLCRGKISTCCAGMSTMTESNNKVQLCTHTTKISSIQWHTSPCNLFNWRLIYGEKKIFWLIPFQSTMGVMKLVAHKKELKGTEVENKRNVTLQQGHKVVGVSLIALCVCGMCLVSTVFPLVVRNPLGLHSVILVFWNSDFFDFFSNAFWFTLSVYIMIFLYSESLFSSSPFAYLSQCLF